MKIKKVLLFFLVIAFALYSFFKVGSKEYSLNEISKKNESVLVSITFPFFEKFPDLSLLIEQYANDSYESFYYSAEREWDTVDSNLKRIDTSISLQPFSFKLKPLSIYVGKKYVSVVMHSVENRADTHPVEKIKSFNYSIESKQLVKIDEIPSIDLQEISEICFEQLKKLYVLEDEMTQEMIDLQITWIKSGTVPHNGNYSVFGLEKNAITVYFLPYSISPNTGIYQKIKIPR